MLTENEQNQIYLWLADDHAYSFFMQVCKAFEFWDDLLDKDKPITDSKINDVMFSLMIALPNNLFFEAHKSSITPLLASIITSWAHLIPKLDGNPMVSRKTSYAVRRCVRNNIDLLIHIIFLVRGMGYIASISDDLAEFINSKEESFSDYVDSLAV